MPSEALNILTELPTPRVWSMLVTIFGDLAQDPSDRIDGTLLTNLTDRMGIKPQAVRVALHRLRNEDWISSQKSGRTANHALTDRGRKESQAVSELIYAAPDELPCEWQVAVTSNNDAAHKDAMRKANFVAIAPRVYIASMMAKPPKDVVSCKGTAAQAWLMDEVIPADLTEQFALIRGLFSQARSALKDGSLSANDIAVLRCLIVHHWRRLVLRHPYLPPQVTGRDWAGHQCRAEMTALLTQLPRPSLMDLQ